jgi:hypothetical protein
MVPEFLSDWRIKTLRLATLRTGHLYAPGKIPGTHFCYRLSQPQGHNAAGRIRLMKNPNRTRDLPICSAVPQPTTPPQNRTEA